MKLKLITAPAVEPVDLDQVKEHLRVDGSDEDATIMRKIMTARKDIETLSLHALITQTWELYEDAWPASEIELPFPPLQSVTGVYYTDQDGTETEFDSSNYHVDTISKPGRVVLKSTASWPKTVLADINGIRVRFVAGFGDDQFSVDNRAVQALLLLVGHYYENREASLSGTTARLLPQGVHDLCWDLRASVKEF